MIDYITESVFKTVIVLFACITIAAARAPASPLARAGAAHAAAAGDDSGILSKSFDLNEDGSYAWEFETANGISQSENGAGGQYAKGAAEWTSPEGEHIILQYTADENGYQPSGSHVPQVPEYITRALEWIRTHPNPEYQN
ncbi:pupal cuticle protein-like [Condylostylus longicornis]|uniref:pupal cuticle protein-like n=1 Tax=Condylostylus longicornis TaxID=2530218 RepID=UPI00244E23DF|nr:pupal cuticle protein-like [Condylostylus longicornis]